MVAEPYTEGVITRRLTHRRRGGRRPMPTNPRATRPRKQRISPRQNAVMWALEEVGGESLLYVVVEIATQFATEPCELFLWELQEALRGLLRLGWIELGADAQRSNALRPSDKEARELAIQALLLHDPETGQWGWQPGRSAAGEIEVILTDAGYAALTG